jgi:hypothetical protein
MRRDAQRFGFGHAGENDRDCDRAERFQCAESHDSSFAPVIRRSPA